MKVLFKIFNGPFLVDAIEKEVEETREVFALAKDLLHQLENSYDEELQDVYFGEDIKVLIDVKNKVMHMEECADMYVNSEKLLEQIQEFYPNASEGDLNHYLKKDCLPIIPHLGRVDFEKIQEVCDTIETFKDRNIFFTNTGVIFDFSH